MNQLDIHCNNGDGRQLFNLTPEGPLPTVPLTEEMTEALTEPDILAYAPAILTVVTDWMDMHSTHAFVIQNSNTNCEERDLYTSLLTFLGEIPSLLEWIDDSSQSEFFLDFEVQGMHLRVEFTKTSDGIRHACIVDHWNSDVRTEGDWADSTYTLRHNCRKVVQEIIRTVIAMNAGIEKLPTFIEWCFKCGHDLKSNEVD